LHVAIRFESTNRIVLPNGRDDDVAFTGSPTSILLPRLALAHDLIRNLVEADRIASWTADGIAAGAQR
jgi:hypothetical protein